MFKLKKKGFTLVELMIVVAILGIISAIAYPSYQDHITQAKRADAMAALTLASQSMERLRATPPYSYDTDGAAATGDITKVFTNQVPTEGGTKYYTLSVIDDGTSYTLTAEPTGSMAGKKILTLTNTGARKWGTDNVWP